MQGHLGLAFQGRLHSGIDDCRCSTSSASITTSSASITTSSASITTSSASISTCDCRNILLVARELHARGVTIQNNGMTKK